MTLTRDPIFGSSFGTSLLDPFDVFNTFSSLPQVYTEENCGARNTNVDWVETPDAHVFKADLPGLKKEQVGVHMEDGRVLRISGERKREEMPENSRWHSAERRMGHFFRRFRLPENAKIDDIKAQVENGVLTVTIPKTKPEHREPRQIDIQ